LVTDLDSTDAKVRDLFQYSTSSFVKNRSRERRSALRTV